MTNSLSTGRLKILVGQRCGRFPHGRRAPPHGSRGSARRAPQWLDERPQELRLHLAPLHEQPGRDVRHGEPVAQRRRRVRGHGWHARHDDRGLRQHEPHDGLLQARGALPLQLRPDHLGQPRLGRSGLQARGRRLVPQSARRGYFQLGGKYAQCALGPLSPRPVVIVVVVCLPLWLCMCADTQWLRARRSV